MSSSTGNRAASSNPPPKAAMVLPDDPITPAMRQEFESMTIDVEAMLDRAMEFMDAGTYVGFVPKDFKTKFLSFLMGQPADYNENLVKGAAGSSSSARTARMTLADVHLFVLKCLSVVAMKGTKVRDQSKSKKEAKDMFVEMAARGVDLAPKTGAQGPETITLQRIAAVFPLEMSMLLATGMGRIVGSTINANFPKSLCHSSAYSFIPAGLSKTSHLRLGMLAQRMAFGMVIQRGPNTVNASVEDITKNVKKFNQIVYDSDLFDADKRVEVFNKALVFEAKKIDKAALFAFLNHIDYAPALKAIAASLPEGKAKAKELKKELLDASRFTKESLEKDPAVKNLFYNAWELADKSIPDTLSRVALATEDEAIKKGQGADEEEE